MEKRIASTEEGNGKGVDDLMKIYVVGLGPGDQEYMAPRAREVLSKVDTVVGYTTYINLIEELVKEKNVISTGMMGEVERCQRAIEEARQGADVAVVSSGDAGIYGMASLIFELSKGSLEVEVVPGITAAVAASALLGSPLSNDFAMISLSDLMTPWAVIEKRLLAVSSADLCIALYNPSSKKRGDYLKKACHLALKHKSPKTLCGYVQNACREGQRLWLGTLEELAKEKVDMFTVVIIGNAATKNIGNRLVTSRGYDV